MAFVCGGPYVDGHRAFGMELLAAPQAYGGTVYYSYIIVPAGSPANDLTSLRGKTFAFTDPMSNSGALVPTFMAAQLGTTPERFFGKVVFSGSHDTSIASVAAGLVDGAAVDSLIWEYANRTDPTHTAKTKVIVKSEPFGIPPVVVPKELDPALKERLRAVLLGADQDPKGREILAGMMIDRFVPIPDSAYDSIRAMQQRVAETRRP
jgi:phosphonate transport system substrate-binding protein